MTYDRTRGSAGISDVINRFATGIDRRDFSLFRKVFTDDCHVVMGDYGSFVGVDAIAASRRTPTRRRVIRCIE